MRNTDSNAYPATVEQVQLNGSDEGILTFDVIWVQWEKLLYQFQFWVCKEFGESSTNSSYHEDCSLAEVNGVLISLDLTSQGVKAAETF